MKTKRKEEGGRRRGSEETKRGKSGQEMETGNIEFAHETVRVNHLRRRSPVVFPGSAGWRVISVFPCKRRGHEAVGGENRQTHHAASADMERKRRDQGGCGAGVKW